MPTYVYRREDGTTFELEQRISAPALTEDPETGQRVQRVITGAGLVFKGSGFYLTDYARKGGSPASESKGSDAKGGSESTAATPAPKESTSSGSTSSGTSSSGGASSTSSGSAPSAPSPSKD